MQTPIIQLTGLEMTNYLGMAAQLTTGSKTQLLNAELTTQFSLKAFHAKLVINNFMLHVSTLGKCLFKPFNILLEVCLEIVQCRNSENLSFPKWKFTTVLGTQAYAGNLR